LFAEALRRTLEDEGMGAVGIATSGKEAVRAAARARPDLVLLDLGLPDAHGLEVGERLLAQLPDAKVVAITALRDSAAVGEAMRVGFHGFLTKETPLAELTPNLRAVLNGQVVLPHRLAPAAAGRRRARDSTAALLASHLTAREKDVLGLLVEGANGAQIARRLSISPNTVRTHVQSILTKLQVHSRLEAAAFAVRHKIVEAPAVAGHAAAG
jgi:two-component system nitrate/nitrite response regulator NarL